MSNKAEDMKEIFKSVAVPPELDMAIEKAIQEGRNHKRKNRVLGRTALAASLALIISVTAVGLKNRNNNLGNINKTQQSANQAGKGSEVEELPVVASAQNLIALIKSHNPSRNTGVGIMYDGAVSKNYAMASEEKASVSSTNDSTGSDYSKTNIQVDGVDEGDIVKTDGQYIYRVKQNMKDGNQYIEIIKVNGGRDMEVVSRIKSSEANISQIYLKGKYLVAVGSWWKPQAGAVNDGSVIGKLMKKDVYGYNMPTSVLRVYDISDRTDVKKIREVETDGYLSSTRMIGGSLYMISNKGIPYARIYDGKDSSELKPGYTDSAAGSGCNYIDYNNIKYCPEAVDSNYIMVTSINLNKPDEQAKVTATLGAAGNIYCSTDNLYVAGYNYGSGDSEQGKTVIYKFSLKDGEVTYKSSGKVSGGILNQFSMDESNGYFRVATTEQNYTKGNSSQLNNLFILDSDMKLSGSLENLAQGEKIYSVRFMGDRAYMVTYRTTDPLFVIDLKSPSAPKVLGELKIPGYSNYLHPYDENHIIGFGKDAEVVGEGTSTERAYYQGMKLAMFDVTDVNNPKLMFKTGIGDRGTDSQLLYDHKALLFSKEKNLLAFPVRVAEIADKSTVNKAAYGETTFIGAYVYNIDLQSGFTLKGKITHAEAGGDIQDNAKEIPYDFSIQRILYIDNNLYTVSDKNIKANSIKDLAEIGSLK